MTDTDTVLSLFRENERFLITTHIGPDGDAIGSQLALGRLLEKMGKDVTMINSDAQPYNLDWLPGIQTVEVLEEGNVEQRKALAAAEVIIVVDTNALDRLGDIGESVQRSGATKLLIDHHTHPETWFDVTYQRDTASSSGELVYELIAAYDPGLVDTDLATTLYTAIMTDTGSFRYSSVTPSVHHIVADLLERGDIRPAPIHTALFDTRSLKGVRLLGRVLDSVTLCYDGQVGYMVVSNNMLEEVGADRDEARGLVNYVLSVESVRAGLLFKETRGGNTKISFRSKGDWKVNEWAQAFGGGGHRNASGAYLRRSLRKTIKDVIKKAPDYLDLEEPETPRDLSEEDASYLAALMKSRS